MTVTKRFLSLLLVTVLTLGVLAGCAGSQEKLQALAGTWSITTAAVEGEAYKLLQSLEASEAETDLADLGSLHITQLVIFGADGSYVFTYDVDAIRSGVKTFYEGYFDDLYEGRTTLNEVHKKDFTDMSQEDFRKFYAEYYETESYEALIDRLVQEAFDYEHLSEPAETGTVSVRGSRLYCTPEGKTRADVIGYSLEGDTLKLSFADAIQVYKKVK